MQNPRLFSPCAKVGMTPLSRSLCKAALLVLCCLPELFAETAQAPTTSQTPSKPYAMYMGVDLAVELQGKLRPVLDVDGAEFIVDVDGQRRSVPTRGADLKIKIDQALKVSPTGIAISDFKPERAYTQDNDPARAYEQAAQLQMGAAAMSDIQMAKVNGMSSPVRGGNTASDASPEVVAAQESAMAQASSDLQSSFLAQGASINSMADAGSRAAANSSLEQYDAFRLKFQISSPLSVAEPYVVLIIRLRSDPDKADSIQKMVYAQKIGSIGPKPRTVQIFRSGFPRGYTLEEVQLHLYSGSMELGTNIAHKRVELSEDERFQFDVVNYISQHRAGTVQPSMAYIGLTKDLRSRLKPEQLDRLYYIKIAKNGMPMGVFMDKACTEKLSDPDIIATLSALRFFPALKEGKAVEAIAPVKL